MADHLERMTPGARSIVQAARRAVKATAPASRESVYQSKPPRSKSALWKIVRFYLGTSEVAGIGTFSTHVLLYFYRGAELDDASGLLEGTGKTMRSIRLQTPQDAARPEVRRMLRKAFRLAADEVSRRAPSSEWPSRRGSRI